MWLVAMKGFAGSGKSTLARAVSRELGWPLIDKDDVKDVIDGEVAEAGRLAYTVMLRLVERQLRQGLSVVCDSPLAFAFLYERARAIAAEHGARLVVVDCVCPDEAIWRERVDGRKGLGLPGHHQTDWAVYRAHLASNPREGVYPIGEPHLVVDTTRPLAEVAGEVIGWLGREGG